MKCAKCDQRVQAHADHITNKQKDNARNRGSKILCPECVAKGFSTSKNTRARLTNASMGATHSLLMLGESTRGSHLRTRAEEARLCAPSATTQRSHE